MIESKEHLRRVTDIIRHWAKFTHAGRELRQGDVENLAHQILEEFYRVQLSCGHYVRSLTDGVGLTHASQDRDGEPCEVSGVYCADCAEAYKRELGARVQEAPHA